MTVAYFDTSALVPLVIDEPTTPRCESAWLEASQIITSSLAYVETHAALARAARLGRLSEHAHRRARHAFTVRWDDLIAIYPRERLLFRAADLTTSHPLRGYDAVHCATALGTASDDFVAVSGDRDLLQAWSELGLHTLDTGG